MNERAANLLPNLFKKIESLCGENIDKNGFAATKNFTMADCFLLSYLS